MNTPKVVTRRAKRLGRGYGSGKGGHTSSRGQKGQKSRGSVGVLFEGYKVRKSLFKRLPLLRGKDKFKAQAKPLTIDLTDLNRLPAGTAVTVDYLIEQKIVGERAKRAGVKVLGNGTLEKKLAVHLPVTKSAASMIEKAGGEVVQK